MGSLTVPLRCVITDFMAKNALHCTCSIDCRLYTIYSIYYRLYTIYRVQCGCERRESSTVSFRHRPHHGGGFLRCLKPDITVGSRGHAGSLLG